MSPNIRMLFFTIFIIQQRKDKFINVLSSPLPMVSELTADSFDREIAGSTPIIIDFWASWCGPCKMLAPIFEEASKDFAGRLRFAKISTEEYPQIAEQQDITGIPSLIMFKNGKEVDRIIGFSPKPALKQKIEAVLTKV